MGKILNQISKYDPSFRDRLEQLLNGVLPELADAERDIISHAMSRHKLDEDILKEQLKIILKAIDLVPGYSIESNRLTRDGKRNGRDKLVLRWSAIDIAKDRFGYLPLMVKRKLFSY